MGGFTWTEKDSAIIAEHYPRLGAKGVLPKLSRQRTLHAIHGHAKRMGVKHREEYRYQEPSAELLRDLKAAYSKGKGSIKEVAEKHGVERGWLKYIAATRGLSRPKNTRWQPEAVRMLEDMEGLCAYQIRRRLAREGYHYSISSISWKMQARHLSTQTDDYTVSDVAGLLGLDHKKVTGWVKRGLLGTTRHANQTGTDHAHTHISQRQLAKFVAEHPTEIDLRRVPPAAQVWFFGMLTDKKVAA